VNKLVELSSIEFPPQLVDNQTQHLVETFSGNVERQGIQMQQYLRMLGKDRETFEQELRQQAESQVRSSLALDAFADAENIQADDDGQEYSRQRKALARLVELATSGDGSVHPGPLPTTDAGARPEGEGNPAAAGETSDTETQSDEAPASAQEG